MADVINLRRARKAKARQEEEAAAEANRVKHGVAKDTRNLAKARAEKERRTTEGHKFDDKSS